MAINPQFQVPECPNCNSPLAPKQAKNGSTYYACPNWRPNGTGCEGHQWFPPKTGGNTYNRATPRNTSGFSQAAPPAQPAQPKKNDAAVEIIFELQAIRAILERLETKTGAQQHVENTQAQNEAEFGAPPEEWMNG